ncbi:hypothetical protein HZH68_014317 [Vespula germanica]|uniref:Uncharacterized protein n=1 Tax=Vespula germanica TaxID=30212 RepID=A0A834MTJ8_VESGE|nr:hypothetical protein HZH68_014317 [Vespula germanica]
MTQNYVFPKREVSHPTEEETSSSNRISSGDPGNVQRYRRPATKAAIVTAVATPADEFISQSARVIRVQTQQRHFLSAFLEVEAGWSKELKRARSTEAEARLSRRRRPFRRKNETEQDGNGSVDWWK